MPKRKLRILTIFLALIIYIPTVYASNEKFNDLTIVVASCDKYAAFWQPFFAALFKQWPSLSTVNRDIPILLIANTKQYSDPRVTMINIQHEISWSDNMLAALKQVKTKYVLIALDDYWIKQPVDEQRLYELYQGLRNEDAAMIQVSENFTSMNEQRIAELYKHTSNEKLRIIQGSYTPLHFIYDPRTPAIANVAYRNRFAYYKASLQMSIWQTVALATLLRPGEDPWTFELVGSIRSHGYDQGFLNVITNEPIKYINAANFGHLTPEALAYLDQNDQPFAEPFPRLGKFNWRVTYQTWKLKLRWAIMLLCL